MLFATAGKIAVQLVNENDELVWKAFLKNDLVAQCHKEDWDCFEPAFATKEAGQMLADAYNDMFATADLDEDASMVKTDDGDVENISDKTDSDCCGNCDKPDGHEPCEPSEGKVIILKLNDLLHEASAAKAAGKPFIHLLNQADLWAKHLNSLSKIALTKQVDDLMAQAEEELNDGLDCTATLETAETLMQIAMNDNQKSVTENETAPIVKKSNLWSRFLTKLLG